MEILEEYFKTYRTTSKFISVFIIAIAFISTYVISRSINVFFDHDFALQIVQTNEQGRHYGLKFSFIALSILWPLIIGSFSSILGLIVKKRDKIAEEIEKIADKSIQLYLLDSYYLKLNDISIGKSFAFIVKYLPLIAILLHASSLVFAFLTGSNFPFKSIDSPPPDIPELSFPEYLIFLSINLISIIYAIRWTSNYFKAISDKR